MYSQISGHQTSHPM
jgi:hypothetical protein